MLPQNFFQLKKMVLGYISTLILEGHDNIDNFLESRDGVEIDGGDSAQQCNIFLGRVDLSNGSC
ncbi:hypothetical protein RchiOBHm_Chr1g0366371 [Rosa chinensis]|uniref:Uncharacterized protein n=1 Tax=Rosa chinensis TaxID=74649 RepID=A0A2P6SKA1_ROSCH|nr:hypothetical protein RchiOBHm_Chr1g0366371 [Rosa chinensis]